MSDEPNNLVLCPRRRIDELTLRVGVIEKSTALNDQRYALLSHLLDMIESERPLIRRRRDLTDAATV